MPTSSDKRFAYGAAICAAVLMGSIGIFVRNTGASAALIAFARMGLGFVFLAGFMAFTGKLGAARIKVSPWLLAGGLSIGLSVWSYILAMGHTSLTNAVFLLYLGPPMAVGLARLLLREKLAPRGAALLGLAFLGCLLVIQFDFSFSSKDSLGYFYGLLAALGYALVIVFNRKLPAGIPPLGRAFYQLLAAALALLPFMDWHDFDMQIRDLPWLAGVGFFQGFLGLGLMIFAIGRLTAQEYGILSYLEPVIATLVGVILFAEPMTSLQVVGGILIILSGAGQIWAARKTH